MEEAAAARRGSQQFRISIKIPSSINSEVDNFRLLLQNGELPQMTISDLKQRLYQEHPIRPLKTDQRLVWRGRLLGDEEPVSRIFGKGGESEEEVFEETVHMVLKSCRYKVPAADVNGTMNGVMNETVNETVNETMNETINGTMNETNGTSQQNSVSSSSIDTSTPLSYTADSASSSSSSSSSSIRMNGSNQSVQYIMIE